MKMKLSKLVESLYYECLSKGVPLDTDVEGAYVSDLLSDVMGKAEKGMVWITSQVHKNIVAVASLKELSAIIVVNERAVSREVRELADSEGVILLSSGKPAFETAGALYALLHAEV